MVQQYVRQKNDYSSAPVAILNAIKWANPEENISYKERYKQIEMNCRTSKYGTDRKEFELVLKDYGNWYNFNVTKARKFDYEKIMKHLTSDRAIILIHYELYAEEEDIQMHCSLWTCVDINAVYGINVLRSPAATVNIWSSGVLEHLEEETIKHTGKGMYVFLLKRKKQP